MQWESVTLRMRNLKNKFSMETLEGHHYSHDVPEDGSIWMGVFGFDIEMY